MTPSVMAPAKKRGAGHEIGKDDGDLARSPSGRRRAAAWVSSTRQPFVKMSGSARSRFSGLALLAVVERDALGVLAHAHQGEAEIRLVALLREVERDQPPADQVGEPGADEGIDQRHPGHVARHVGVDADEAERQRARELPQDEQERDQRRHGAEHAQQERAWCIRRAGADPRRCAGRRCRRCARARCGSSRGRRASARDSCLVSQRRQRSRR